MELELQYHKRKLEFIADIDKLRKIDERAILFQNINTITIFVCSGIIQFKLN